MAIADGLPSRDEAARAFECALADLRAYLAEEDAIVARQLAGTDERLRQLREELALLERGRDALAARRALLARLAEAAERAGRAKAALRFA